MKTAIDGLLRKNPTNPRYFTDNSGQAIYLTGSHTWAVMQEMWPENEPRHNMDYDSFLQMMEDYDHNFLRFWQFSLCTKNSSYINTSVLYDPMPYERTGPGLARDGLPKFDLTRFSQSYFDRLRSRVEKAATHGIYASIMMFDAWVLKVGNRNPKDPQPWEYHVFNLENNINAIDDDAKARSGRYEGRYTNIFSMDCPGYLEVQKAFIRKTIDTINDLDNVLYEICNEIPLTPEAMLWQENLCQYIHEYEKSKPKQHMVGITPEGSELDCEALYKTSADWVSPPNGRAFEYRHSPPANDGRKVMLIDTDHLWGHGGEVPWIWKSFTRGMNVLFMDPWEPLPGYENGCQDGDITRNQRYYYAWDDLRRNLGYTHNIALSFDLNKLIPDISFCTSGYCLANKNEQYVCYFPAGSYEGIDLSGVDGDFQMEWLNPATGVTVSDGMLGTKILRGVFGSQRATIRAPFDGPAVLLLFKQRKLLPKRYELINVNK